MTGPKKPGRSHPRPLSAGTRRIQQWVQFEPQLPSAKGIQLDDDDGWLDRLEDLQQGRLPPRTPRIIDGHPTLIKQMPVGCVGRTNGWQLHEVQARLHQVLDGHAAAHQRHFGTHLCQASAQSNGPPQMPHAQQVLHVNQHPTRAPRSYHHVPSAAIRRFDCVGALHYDPVAESFLCLSFVCITSLAACPTRSMLSVLESAGTLSNSFFTGSSHSTT